MKRKKGPGAAHKATAGENGEGKVASSSATVEPRQVVDHPGSAGTGTITEFDFKSTVKDSKHTQTYLSDGLWIPSLLALLRMFRRLC
jgi:hypothetical protein